MVDLTGKVALVTGGSRGIGRSTCQALVARGASIVVNYSSDSNSADELVKQLGSKHAHAVQADAGSLSGVEKMVQATLNNFGKLDILVANAGARHDNPRSCCSLC